MKERPILFSGPMIRAIQDKEHPKTVTRRPIKIRRGRKSISLSTDLMLVTKSYDRGLRHFDFGPRKGLITESLPCLYCMIGDRLWVRETHFLWGVKAPLLGQFTKAGRIKRQFKPDVSFGVKFPDGPPLPQQICTPTDTQGWFKRPSIFMPRWASRIQLVVKSVRAERLQDITPGDIELEGISVPEIPLHEWLDMNMDEQWEVYVKPFRELWDAMYAKKPELQFDANPWVWLTAFARKVP